MDVDIIDDQYIITLSRSQFFLLLGALDEHLLMRGERFEVSVYDRDLATEFANELAVKTKQARDRRSG